MDISPIDPIFPQFTPRNSNIPAASTHFQICPPRSLRRKERTAQFTSLAFRMTENSDHLIALESSITYYL
jgi:hypothetical protein